METNNEERPIGLLGELHHHFQHSSEAFKKLVMRDCGYSTATYYRRVNNPKYNTLTRAEKANVLEASLYVVGKVLECITKHKE